MRGLHRRLGVYHVGFRYAICIYGKYRGAIQRLNRSNGTI